MRVTGRPLGARVSPRIVLSISASTQRDDVRRLIMSAATWSATTEPRARRELIRNSSVRDNVTAAHIGCVVSTLQISSQHQNLRTN